MKFLLPQGIGDSVWALHKIRSVAKSLNADKIEVLLNYWPPMTKVQSRAVDFVKRFKFVDSVEMIQLYLHSNFTDIVDSEGRYIYIPDGWMEYGGQKFYVLMPNSPLERGIRLENWLPEFSIDWNTSDEFVFEEIELENANTLKKDLGDYCVFYLGGLHGNVFEGHNRGGLWSRKDWVELGKTIQEKLNLKIVVVGADYDFSYWQDMILPTLREYKLDEWENLIGELSIAATFAVTKNARFVVSFQSGIGIFSSYLGVPTAIFWRAKGDSISLNSYVSFEEAMASAWVRPEMLAAGKHLPLIYGRHNPEYITSEIVNRGW